MSATANGVDPALVKRIVDRVKAQGIFDQFRRDCLADVDTKPAYQNLGSRVEGYVSTFLSNFTWTPDMNKNQLRNTLRRQINESEMLASGVERIIEQVVDSQIQHRFLPRIEAVVKEYLHSDTTPSSGTDVKAAEAKAGKEGSLQMTQQGSTAASLSPMLTGIKASPADSPSVAWSVATAALQSSAIPLQPPPLPGESEDQPKPPPLPDTTSFQEKPEPPPLPKSREASPPPLPPSSVPERKRTPSISSTPSLDSVSSDPLSESDEEKPKSVEKALPKKAVTTASAFSGKVASGKQVLVKKRISIVKKVVVRKADGTKVIRVVRMDPNKATAKKLLMKAAARQAGDQGASPKGTGLSSPKVTTAMPTDESRKNPEVETAHVTDPKPPTDGSVSNSGVTAQLGKRKHLSSSASFTDSGLTVSPLKASEEPLYGGDSDAKLIKEEPPSSEDAMKGDGDAKGTVDDLLSKDLEDVSSPGSALDSLDGGSESEQKLDRDEDEKEDLFPDNISDSDSHISDVTVSSVHTSDLSSFDEKISSSSSSSSSSEEESEEDDTDDYSAKQENPPGSSLGISPAKPDTSVESSSSPALSSPAGLASPQPWEVRWRRQHMSDMEDEAARTARRRRAETKAWIRHHHRAQGSKAKAEAKEERARRRQQLKEEREKEHEESHSGEGTRSKRLRDDESPAESKLSKQQLKEQKLQEKRREVKRQRTLLSQSDDSSVPTDGALPSPLRRMRSVRRSECRPVTTYRHDFYLKKRKAPEIPFHYLLSLDMAYKMLLKKSQQRAKLLKMRAKEEKEGKKPYVRFSFQAPGKKELSRWQEEAARRKRSKFDDRGNINFESQATESCLENVVERTEVEEISETMDIDNVTGTVDARYVEEAMDTADVPETTDVAGVEEVERNEDVVEAEKTTEVLSGDIVPNEEENKPPSSVSNTAEDDMEVTVSAVPTVSADSSADSPSRSNDPVSKVSEEHEMEPEVPVEAKSPLDINEVKLSSKVEEDDTKGSKIDLEPSDSTYVPPQEDGIIKEESENIPTDESGAVENERSESRSTDLEVTPEECESKSSDTAKGTLTLPPENVEGQELVVKELDEAIESQNDKENVEIVEEEEVPTFIVLEREEISSDESELDGMAGSNKSGGSPQGEVPKLPSIFQQTEAISSDEELDDIMPPAGNYAEKEGGMDEARSEGEVEEGMSPTEEGEPITKLTEDISGDDFSDVQSSDNPPTPTMDEQAEYKASEEESSSGQTGIPIVVKSKSLVIEAKDGCVSSSGSGSDAESTRRRESTPKEEEGLESNKISKKEEEIEEGEFEEGEVPDIEEGEVPEEKEPMTTRGARQRRSSNQGHPEEQMVYGKRPRRRTFSPHHTKDDDYFYFGLPKRTRHESPTLQSPASPTPDLSQKKGALRERSIPDGRASHPSEDPTAADSSKQTEDSAKTVPKERRSSRHSRRVSPPRRYSPSELRTPPKGKGVPVVPPLPVSPSQEPTPPPPQQQQQQPHRHFTRRMSGRDEERRPHRYEDMYYYDNKRAKSSTSTTPASSKPTRRTSAEEKKRKR